MSDENDARFERIESLLQRLADQLHSLRVLVEDGTAIPEQGEADEAMEAAVAKMDAADRYCLEVERILEAKSREYNHQGPTFRH